MQAFGAYSFANVLCSIVGPGGVGSIGASSGAAEGGITIELAEDKDTLTMGADGTGMHSLHAAQGGTITIRLLKVAPMNFILSTMYDLQSASSTTWGQNTITLQDIYRGDSITCVQCAFKRLPSNTWAKDGNTIEWAFNSVYIFETLGPGLPGLGS